MRGNRWRVVGIVAVGFMLTAVAGQAGAGAGGPAQALTDELYPGERELWERARREGVVASYDTGPTWANWQGVFDAFTRRYGIEIVWNDLGSGATVVRLEKEAANPQADTAYYFMPFGELARQKGLTAGHRPPGFERIPAELRDPEGHWFTIHMGTVAFAVNKRLVREIPKGWEDLLKPAFRRSVVYLDPRTTGIGYAIVISTAHAFGGSVDNLEPGIDFLARLQQAGSVRMIEKTTEYNKFIKGEIPVWITYDFNAYRAKYIGQMGDDVEIVIPREGTITAPYAISLVKGAPHPNTARLWLNFILSNEGQRIFAEGFVRPVLDVPLPAEVGGKFLPAREYARAVNVDWVEAQERQAQAAEMWGARVLGQ